MDRIRNKRTLLSCPSCLSLLIPLLCASLSAATEPTTPTRVVTLAPSITECVFALGAGDRVVGVSDFCKYPPEAKTRQRCGGWTNPNFEILSSLRTDLVIIQGRHAKARAFCEERRIPLLGVDMDSVATIQDGLRAMGKALGAPEKAEAECARIRKALEALRVERKPSERPRVFLCLGRAEKSLSRLFTVGKGTFLDELVTLVGGRNVFGDVTTPYPQVSKEALIRRAPDIIIELRPGETIEGKRREQLRSDWARLASIPAVSRGDIRIVTDDCVLLPGPRVPQAAAALKAAIEDQDKGVRKQESEGGRRREGAVIAPGH